MPAKPAGRAAGTGTRVSIREVAQHAGVGQASVSRVLSGHADVSAAMRQRVLAAVAELGYEPNLLAQGLRRRATMSVGFVASDISNPLVADIVRGTEAVLRGSGYSMLLTNSEADPVADARNLRVLQQRQVDGAVLLPSSEDDPHIRTALATADVPLVVLDREFASPVRAAYVLSDHYTGVTAAVRALLDLGHRRTAIIVGRDVRPSRERIRALTDIYAQRGLPETYAVDTGPLSIDHGREAMERLLGRPDPPTAVVLGGNQLLVGALEYVRAQGLSLPRDLSLVSSDDVPVGRLNQPPIAVIARDTELIGRSAARLLLDQFEEPTVPPRSCLLPTWFEPRASCGPPPSR